MFLYVSFQQKMDMELSSSTLIESFERFNDKKNLINDPVFTETLPDDEDDEKNMEVIGDLK